MTNAHVMENENLRVWLDPTFPRVWGYFLKNHEGIFNGSEKNTPKLIEVNGKVFKAPKVELLESDRAYHVTPKLSERSAIYTFQLWRSTGRLAFQVVFELNGSALEMSLQNVDEMEDFQLHTLYFPNHALLTVNDEQEQASVCRTDFSRNERGIIKLEGVYKGPVGEMPLDEAPQPTHWGYVYTSRSVGLLTNNIPVFPVHTQATGSGENADALSVWNGVYHHRVQGEKMPPLQCSIRFIDDLSGDGTVDWMDGAWWLREHLPLTKSAYDGAFVYKIKCAQLPDDRFKETLKQAPNPTVYATFEQCLDIIKRVYHLTHGQPQIVYLVGWQHLGHDDKYPDLSVVNPYLGGKEKLLALMKEAENFNATVSLHVNCDVAYKDSPGWDPEILSTNPDGHPAEWSVMHNQMNYHISHFKDMRKGSLISRVDALLNSLPIRHSIHYDAFRYTNESWDNDGYIGMTAELLAAQKMFDRYAKEDIGITIEGLIASPALVGRIDGVWHSYTQDTFLAFLLHRRWVGGGKKTEDLALGAYINAPLSPDNTASEISDIYYRGYLLRDLLQRHEMTHVVDDGSVLTVQYGEATSVQYDRVSKRLHAVSNGIDVARNGDRFVPISDSEILTYSQIGGAMVWQLPTHWNGENLEMIMLSESGKHVNNRFKIKPNGFILFEAKAMQPYVILKVDKR